MPTLDELIAKHHLVQHASAIKSVVRPSVKITRARVNQADLSPLDSRLGGLPHLPKELVWPRWNGNPLGHLATIRLSQLTEFDAAAELPRQGLLYFWYAIGDAPWGFDPADAGAFHVDFVPDESQPLELRSMPMEGVSESFAKDVNDMLSPGATYDACRIEFGQKITIPNAEWLRAFRPALANVGNLNEYWALFEELASKAPQHQLLGHPLPAQGPMELECQLVSNGLYCGDERGYKHPRRKELEAGALDWRLLLQIDSDDDIAGWMWGDCGRLYFWMPQAAMKSASFEKVWGILQCG